jgi:predicted double-glycine peptidase
MDLSWRAVFCSLAVLTMSGCLPASPPLKSDRPVSYLAMRYEATVPQLKDFTCGAASLATVLTYYWGERTTESDILKALEGRYTKEEIQKKQTTGLSFDDLIYAAERLGFAAQAGQAPETELVKLQGPAIVRLKKSESFQHFVVLRKVGDGAFYLSDPVVGQVTQSSAEFREQYTGDVLAIWRRGSPLPRAALLASPRDGISVSNSLVRAINEPQISPQKGL